MRNLRRFLRTGELFLDLLPKLYPFLAVYLMGDTTSDIAWGSSSLSSVFSHESSAFTSILAYYFSSPLC
jgi:hypothetical protein